MLRRGPRCLKHRGCILDRLLSKFARSRRALHSNFWSHGAADIDLPPWWVFSLQVPSDKTTALSPVTVRRADVYRVNRPTNNPFLDFLYPPKTIHYLQNFVPHQYPFPVVSLARVQRSNPVRTFASGPSDEHATSPIDGEIMEPSQEQGINIVMDDAMTDLAEQGNQTVEALQHLSLEDNDSSHDTETSTFEEDLFSVAEEEYAGALRIWETLDQVCSKNNIQAYSTKRYKLAAKTLFEKADALQGEYNLRTRELFDQIPTRQRLTNHYHQAIYCALDEHDFARALILHQEAASRKRGRILTSEILCQSFIHEDWRIASRIWNVISHRSLSQKVPLDIWKGVNNIPYSSLQPKVLRLEGFYNEQLDLWGWDVSSPYRELLHRLILNCLSRLKKERRCPTRDSFRELIDMLKRFVISLGSRPWHNAIEGLLSLNLRTCDKTAMRLYTKMRWQIKTVPPKAVLIPLMVRLRDDHHVHAMQVFEDYQRFHTDDPEKGAKTMINALAFRGDLDAVLKIIAQQLRRSPGVGAPYYMERLLVAYMRRADITKVVELFESLETDFNFKPTLSCWHCLILAHSRVDDVREAVRCFEKLCKSDTQPSSKTYETMLHVHAKRGDLKPIKNLLKEIRERDVQITMPMLDYVVLAYVKRNEVQSAEKLCRQFLTSNVEGSRLRMWNFVLLQNALKWDFQRVNRVFLEMQTHSIGYDRRTLGALMLSLCNEHRPEQAHAIVNKVMPRLNIEPTTLHWAILMKGYLQVNKTRNAFMIYRSMIRLRVRPDYSTKILLLKAASMSDVQELRYKNRFLPSPNDKPWTLRNSDAMLKSMLDELSPTDISLADPIVGVGPSQRIDEAAVSGAFQFLTYLYGVKGNSKKVDWLYKQYETTSKRFYPARPTTPSIRMIASLMVDYRKTKYAAGMEQSWQLARQKAKALSCTWRDEGRRRFPQINWVLPQYHSILDLCLGQYILFLRESGREGEIFAILRTLRSDGYWISSLNLNLYVQSLAASRQPRQQIKAFLECEKHLMPGWQGWFSTTSMQIPDPEIVREKVKQQQPRFRGINMNKAAPMYRTLVMMARLWVDLRAKDQFERAMGGNFLQRLGRGAPRTVEAIQGMPRMADEWQTRYLAEDV